MSIFSVGGSTPSDGFEVKSVRINNEPPESSSPQYFKRSKSASDPNGWKVHGNQKTWTISFWMKWDLEDNNGSQAERWIYWVDGDGINSMGYDHIGMHHGQLRFYCYTNSWSTLRCHIKLTRKLRDPAAWYHCMIVMDSTLATAADRTKFYINGVRETDFDINTQISQNQDTNTNMNANTFIGTSHSVTTTESFGGYLAEFYRIDGQALGPEYFGETDSGTNQWKPKNPTDIKEAVTFGTNGFYLPFSNDVLDNSFLDTGTGGRQTVTAVGNVHTDTTIKKFGTASAQFDGTGDAITSADSADYTLADGMFTLEAFVRLDNTDRQVFISKYDESGNNREFKWEYDSNNMMFGYSTNGSSNTWLSFSWTPSVDTWYHIAICRDHNHHMRAFVDGTQIGTTQEGVTGTFYNSSAILSIGANIHNGSVFNSELTGYMDEIRISNIARYHENFTAPTAEFEGDTNTILLLHCNGSDGGTTFLDSAPFIITRSGNAKNVRIIKNSVGFSVDTTGGQHIAGPKFGTGCASFTKSASGANYLSVADSNDWTLGSTFTLEGWFNFDDVANNDLTLLNHWKGNGVLTAWTWQIDGGNTVKFFYSTNGTSSAGNSAWTWTPENHRWYHLAIVRNSADLMFFVDGTQVGSTHNIGSSTIANIAWPLEIGYYSNIGGYKFKGYMDEIRISDNARYTSAFTPSTSAFSNDGNTKLLMHCDGTHGSTSFTDSSSTGHTITQNGDVIILAPKIGTGVNRTNGGDCGLYIPGASCPWAEFGTGDFTVEAWVSLDDITTNNQQFFTHRNTVNSGDWVFWWDSSTGLNWSGSNNTLAQGGTTGWANNTWVHIAASRASGVNKIFVNGTVVATNSSATQDYNATASLFIASYSTGTGSHNSSGGNIAGFMDEVRITPGKALYTSNFTPSTTAYTDDIDTRLLLHFDGGGPGTAGSDTNIGQGTYYHDSSTNAIFYEDNLPKYKSYINFDGSGDYLTASGSSTPTDRGFDFTTAAFAIEFWFWVKDSNAHTALVHSPNYYSGGYNGNWAFDCYQENVRFNVYNGTGAVGSVDSTGDKIECGVWNHVAFCRDGSGNSRIFINGELSSSVSTALNGQSITDGSYGVEIGGNISYAGPGDLNGGMDNIRISNSARYTSNFTKPTDRLTSDSDTVFLLNSDFTDGGLGADHSGNYNYFTPMNLGVDDIVEDSPTNNFCTLNRILDVRSGTTISLTEGNTTWTNTASGTAGVMTGTMGVEGKVYFEAIVTTAGSEPIIGFASNDKTAAELGPSHNTNADTFIYEVASTGRFCNGSTVDTGPSSTGAGGIIGVAYDTDSGKVWFALNGAWYNSGNPTAGTNASFTIAASHKDKLIPCIGGYNGTVWRVNFGQDASFAGYRSEYNLTRYTDSNDRGNFFYEPPSGYLALCTDNLPDPSIADPTAHFNTVLHTGAGGTYSLTGVGFQPDLIWIKQRSGAERHTIVDSVRGANKNLTSHDTDAETTDATDGHLDSIDSDGWTGEGDKPATTSTNATFAGWYWKAGGTASSNSDGSITSSVSANTTAGFSIVSWTGDTSSATIGHGLSQAPELIIIKSRDGPTGSYNWPSYSKPTGTGGYINLDQSNAWTTNSGFYGTAPTASVFSPGSHSYVSGAFDFIAYCFHSVDGYSKIGSYEGNANAAGPFVYTGFKPAFVIIKGADQAGSSWFLMDNKRDEYNVVDKELFADSTSAEGSGSRFVDFNSNGFKLRANDALNYASTMIYYAVAEEPFKTANAR